jgi:hypothetical protein
MRASLCILYLAVAACGGSKGPVAPVVTLTQAGEEPWRVLRYTHVAGTTERVELRFKLRRETTFENTVMEQGRSDADFPTIEITGPITVADVAADGTARLVLRVETTTLLDDVVDPRLRSRFAARAAALRGTTFTWQRAPDGTTTSAEVGGEASAIADAVTTSAVRFPDAPVGIGASWQITSTVVSDKIRWRRTTTYRVRDRSDSSVTIDADTELHADEQTVSAEPNATTVLESGSGRTSAHEVVPLGGIVGDGQADAHLEMDLMITRKQLRVRAAVKTDSVFSIRSRP